MSDILASIDQIISFTNGVDSYQAYSTNNLVKSAVERHLAIIGEAVNKFLRESERNELQYATQMISLRNRLIHSYDNIDDRIIWTILQRHLTPLKGEIELRIRE